MTNQKHIILFGIKSMVTSKKKKKKKKKLIASLPTVNNF